MCGVCNRALAPVDKPALALLLLLLLLPLSFFLSFLGLGEGALSNLKSAGKKKKKEKKFPEWLVSWNCARVLIFLGWGKSHTSNEFFEAVGFLV